MLTTLFYGKLQQRDFRKFGVRLFAFILFLFFVIYTLLRVCLYGDGLQLGAELLTVLKMAAVGAIISGGAVLLLYLVEVMDGLLHRRRLVRRWRSIHACVIALFLVGTVQAQTPSGSRRDAATGLLTQYLQLTLTRTKLIMNEEVLSHTQVPLGEKFTIINESVSGFVQKGGKVSIGCSLKITDEKGKVLMEMGDLFAAKDVFTLAESKFLKCTVNTGKPMTYDKKYNVVAVFWDKWGKGKITNRVAIEIIDLP